MSAAAMTAPRPVESQAHAMPAPHHLAPVRPGPNLRLVPDAPASESKLRPIIGSRPRQPLGDPTPLVCTVAKTAVEVVLGQPGVDQLTRWVTPTVRSSLQAQHSLARRASYTMRGTVTVIRVRLCRVSSRAVEAAIVATEGERSRAIAMRLEACSGRWLVTALDIG